MAAVEQRLRPPMSAEEAEQKLGEARGQRDEVLQLGLIGELWHDADLEAFATIRRDGRQQTWKVRSRDDRLYLVTEYRRRHGGLPTNQALSEGIEAIEATARDNTEREVFVRVGGASGRVYLDLVNDAWTVVEIDAAGWRVISDPPVRFVPARPAASAGASVEQQFRRDQQAREFRESARRRVQTLCQLDRRLPAASGTLYSIGPFGRAGHRQEYCSQDSV
jgi:hypothetical protein